MPTPRLILTASCPRTRRRAAISNALPAGSTPDELREALRKAEQALADLGATENVRLHLADEGEPTWATAWCVSCQAITTLSQDEEGDDLCAVCDTYREPGAIT